MKGKIIGENGNNIDSVLARIFDLRRDPLYHAAEIKRNGSDAETLAGSADPDSRGAIHLLIGTWEEIARLLNDLVKTLGKKNLSNEAKKEVMKFANRVFSELPVGYMWDALEPGIEYIRQFDGNPGCGKKFEELADVYDAWIRRQSKSYRTKARNGLNAMFG